jgi:transposase
MTKPVLTRRHRLYLLHLVQLKLEGHPFTQVEIAEMVGVGQKTVSRYERAWKNGMSKLRILRYGVPGTELGN